MPTTSIAREHITGLVLAGGQGSRMGGVDKGLQAWHGAPLAQHALRRLQAQVGAVMLSANRHLDTYAAMGAPVWPDRQSGYCGPLAGLLSGLEYCPTPWLLTVPCDAPLFPPDLAPRLAQAAAHSGTLLAMASAREGTAPAPLRPQPVFCLVHHSLHDDLARYLADGGRKAMAWASAHRPALVAFDAPGDDPHAFANANTLAELTALQALQASPVP